MLIGANTNGYCGAKRNTDSAPNIIIVLIDDMGWKDFSCFGNTEASTPNIDGMASEGIRFNQFYVNAPICSPSRVAITTGQYPQRHKITSYLAKRSANIERGMVNWLDPSAPTIARYLKSNGYATGHFGKWHMGGQRDVTDAPAISEYGFDTSITNFEGMGPKLLPIVQFPDPDDPTNIIETHIWDEQDLGGPITYMMRSKITGGYIDNAINFIDKAESDNKPFYINIWPDDVHTPMYPNINRWSDNESERYLAVLEEMDEQFAVLFNRIKNDDALINNTIILICSDNGPAVGMGSAGEFKGFKGNLYEGGLRSPLVVWGPGFVNPQMKGNINNSSVLAGIDILPSMLALAGIDLPQGIEFNGHDMSATFLGQNIESRPEPIFFRRPPEIGTTTALGNMPDLAMRSGKWKLLCDIGGLNPQLYNLDVDVGESNNLYSANKELADQMIETLLEWNLSMPGDAGVPDLSYLKDNIDPGEVAFYFPFDGNIDDASSNNVSLTQDVGSTPTFEEGHFGQGIELNKMRFLTDESFEFNPYNSHTLAAWIKINSLPKDNGVDQVIVHQLDDPLNAPGRTHLQVLNSNNYFSSFTGGADHRTSANSAAKTDAWYHLAVVWDIEGKNKYFYINGDLVSNIPITSTEKCFGQYVVGANKTKQAFVDGCLDDLILIKQALTPAAVKKLADNGFGHENAEIQKDVLKEQFIITPNPNKGVFQLSFVNYAGLADYKITNLNGEIIKTGSVHSNSKINIPDLANGLYLFTLNINGITHTKKMIVQ
jgi:arylsulfatase A-like enzyme